MNAVSDGARTSAAGKHSGTWLCTAGAAIGVVGLLGWIIGSPRLTTYVRGLPSVQPNTALALALIGIAGAVRPRHTPGPLRMTLAVVSALAVVTLGTGTLAGYTLGIDIGLLRIGRAIAGSETATNVSSPFTAGALVLLGVAVLMLDVRRGERMRPSEWLALCATLMAFTGLTGIILGAEPLYRYGRTSVIAISLPTAISLLFTASGLLIGPACGGVMRLASSPGPGGSVIRRLAPPAVVVPILLALAVMRVFPSSRPEDVAVPVAVLAASTAAMTVVLVVLTARPLNRADEDLRVSRAQLGQLVEFAPDGIFTADLEGRYTDVNDAGCRLLSLTREEIIGKTIVDLIPASDVERLWQTRTALLGGAVHVDEWSLRRKDGSFVPVEVSATILPDGRWQGFVRDISERRRMTEEQKRLYREAQRATHLRDEVLAIVAHDLRNPLSMILMETRQAPPREGETERRAVQPERIQRAAMRMNRLIQDLLDVARMEAGRLIVDRRPMSATQLVADAVEAQGTLASANDLGLRAEAPATLPDIVADRDRLLQVFENLIANAIGFTPQGGFISVGAAAQDAAVRFWVSDTGSGIADADQAHLFDRFWQARSSRRGGAGLGLQIVKGIVEAHGGHVWVESAMDRGSTFFFDIPAADSH